MTKEDKLIAKEEAQRILQEDLQNRIRTFSAAYERLCQEHGMRIVGLPAFSEDGRVGVQLQARVMQ